MPTKKTSSKLTEKQLQSVDKANMKKRIAELCDQFETEYEVLHAKNKIKKSSVTAVVISGLGGSAIGGDLVRTYLGGEVTVPILVNRNYTLPEFVGKNTLVVISSYSGNTEETLSVYHEAIKRGAKIACVTSGGQVEKLANKHGHFTVKIPGGSPPRAALGLSFTALIRIFTEFAFCKSKLNEIQETAAVLRGLSFVYSDPQNPKNIALKLANLMKGTLPVIYTSDDYTAAIGVRWKGQICENAKMLAYSNVFPELNHNELVGWKENKDILKKCTVVMIHDETDHPRTSYRMDVTEGLIGKLAANIIHVSSVDAGLMARLFSLIILGDWVSYYLAILNKVDPSPVTAIDYLKKSLEGYKG
ncbi:MAG: bifunctional phosphoglucose/phosphomannose isomerase [Chloroherpetonaceae bacterium]|nr:bifunctional phosphoglucose/phosphomannose isomerase [Chloroherpetonaceae bacterium]